jgi:hypothetical protein
MIPCMTFCRENHIIMQSRLNEPVCELFVDEKNDLDCSDHQIKEENSALIFGFYYTIVLAQEGADLVHSVFLFLRSPTRTHL